ncbi:cilia- and flagella-associated protein 77 isoform X2 [Sceloporus undulatus]|uniref:cilia- and flagella-associated protein 77 isoform X2 n=1 Tax=Sceloporus undulatus TaxID=8520 RepID=UPI001C4ACBD5|nr:cilia- and flagella-associated protein 77 isoform X2 [Sceloporus undulatus]
MAASNTPKKSPVNVRLPRRRSVSQICPPPRRPMTLAELYPGCENERLGVARESMLQNHLIAKPEVGKPRRSCYTLPGYGFNYGLYLRGTDGGVPEAICHWNAMKPRVVLEKEKPRDYKAMNSLAVKDGYITSHEHNLYRQAKDLRVDEVDERRFKRTPPKVPADMTYGRPARHVPGFCCQESSKGHFSSELFLALPPRLRQRWMSSLKLVGPAGTIRDNAPRVRGASSRPMPTIHQEPHRGQGQH